MKAFSFQILTDRFIAPDEFASLMSSAGWGKESAYDSESVTRSISGATFVAHARNSEGKMIGYLSVLSDGVFTAFVDVVLVHPSFQRSGVGSALVEAAEKHFSGVPIYVMPFLDQKEFFEKRGYKIPGRPMQALSKRNEIR